MKQSTKIEDDNEDLVEVKKIGKGSRGNSSKIISKEENPETQEILEYALNDFRDLHSINKFRNLKYITLNNQNILSIDVNNY